MLKHILDKWAIDSNLHIRMMTEAKIFFDKYWRESNLIISYCVKFEVQYETSYILFFDCLSKRGEFDRILNYLSYILNELYQEYVDADKDNRKIEDRKSGQLSSSDYDFIKDQSETTRGLNDYKSFIQESGAIKEHLKLKLDDYLGEELFFLIQKILMCCHGGREIGWKIGQEILFYLTWYMIF